MWELIKDLLLVSLGMGMGVVIMCIVQVGKMADKSMEQIEVKGGRKNEFRSESLQLVLIQRTEPCAHGDCGNRYLSRL